MQFVSSILYPLVNNEVHILEKVAPVAFYSPTLVVTGFAVGYTERDRLHSSQPLRRREMVLK
jgi:hypothetical protein